jgi:hypothetical protein
MNQVTHVPVSPGGPAVDVAQSNARSAQIEAVIIRADGTREELGVVSYWHRTWWRRVLWNVSHGLKQLRKRFTGR